PYAYATVPAYLSQVILEQEGYNVEIEEAEVGILHLQIHLCHLMIMLDIKYIPLLLQFQHYILLVPKSLEINKLALLHKHKGQDRLKYLLLLLTLGCLLLMYYFPLSHKLQEASLLFQA